MKRIIAIITVFVFAVMLAGMVYAQADYRSPDEKLEAGRAYLKLLDQKIIRLRNQGKTALVDKMHVEKKATIARMQVWKAEAEAMEAAPPPVPVAPTPPPAPVARPAAPSDGLFGLGLKSNMGGGYINTGKGQLSGSLGVSGNLVFSDMMGLGSMVGLSEDSVTYKVGGGYYQGGGGLKAVPLWVGGTLNLPVDMMGGLESYLTGGLNYVVYGNGQTSGKIGGDASFGMLFDLGMGLEKTGFEIGYSVVRSDLYSSKGLSLSVSQAFVL
ncbi:MAG: hypothetical protein ABIA67_02815 [Candidatus Margulisiibacteriota bacterium]